MWQHLLGAAVALLLAAANPRIDGIRSQAAALKAKGDAAGALELYRKAAAAESNSAELYDEIGFLEAVLHRPADAKQAFHQAIQLDPRFAPAHYHLGVALWLEQQYTDGLAALQAAARLAPKVAEYRFRLGV